MRREKSTSFPAKRDPGRAGAFIELFGIEQKNDAGEKVDYTTEDCDITNSTSVILTSVSGNDAAIVAALKMGLSLLSGALTLSIIRRACSSGFIAWTGAIRARPAARDSGWRS